jgi:bile acid:Na+ symporter, BASS family
MLGMGLSLVVDDFKRVVQYPKAVFIGLVNQLVFLPLIGFGIAEMLGLSPMMAVGLMILAACPGGVTSNLISHLCRGNIALSITLTSISSLVTVLTIPFIVNFALGHFASEGKDFQVPVVQAILQILAITIVPVAIGMVVRHKWEDFAKTMDKPVRMLSALILVVVIAGAILKNQDILAGAFKEVGLASLALNVATLLVGFLSARLFRLNFRDSLTVSIESGIQNGTLGIVVAASLIGNNEMAIPPAIYSLIMFGTAGILIGWTAMRGKAEAGADVAS